MNSFFLEKKKVIRDNNLIQGSEFPRNRHELLARQATERRIKPSLPRISLTKFTTNNSLKKFDMLFNSFCCYVQNHPL